MAITRYDRPVEMEFIDTYVPIPFQQMAAVAAMQQKRYDTDMATQEVLKTELGEFDTLDEVYDSISGTMRKTGHRELVQAESDEISGLIDEVVKSGIRPGTPEFRAKMAGIANRINKFKSPTGLAGRAAASKENYLKLEEMRQKAGHLADSPWSDLQNMQKVQSFLDMSKEGSRFIDFTSPHSVGQEFNRTTELAGLMDNIKDSYIQDIDDGAGGTRTVKGLSYNDAAAVAKKLAISTPQIWNNIMQEATLRKARGEEGTVAEIADKIANREALTQANINQRINLSAAASSSRKKGSTTGEEDSFITGLSTRIPVTITPGLQSPATVERDVQMHSNEIERIKLQEEALNAKYHIDEDYMGTPIDANGQPIPGAPLRDLSTVFEENTRAVEEHQTAQAELRSRDENMKIEAGLTPEYLQSPEFLAVAEKTRKEAKERVESELQTAVEVAMETGTEIPKDLTPTERFEKESQMFNTLIRKKGVDPAYTRYLDMYEKLSSPYAVNVPTYPLSNKFVKENPIVGDLSLSSGAFESAFINMIDNRTGMPIEKREQHEALDIEGAKLIGFQRSPIDNGEIRLAYNVKARRDSDGNKIDSDVDDTVVTVKAPFEFPNILVEEGFETQASMVVRDQLFGGTQAALDNRNLDGEGVAEFKFPSGVDDKGDIVYDNQRRVSIKRPIASTIGRQEWSAMVQKPVYNKKGEVVGYELEYTADGAPLSFTSKTEGGLVGQLENYWATTHNNAVQAVKEGTEGSEKGESLLGFKVK